MTLRGSLSSFPLETIVQLLAGTGKTGQLDVRAESETGSLGFAEGRLVAALAGNDTGQPALGAVFALQNGDFEFAPWLDAPVSNLSGNLDELLDRAVVERDRIVANRQVIPDDRMRFRLSARAAEHGEVKLTSDQWRTLLAVNGERDLTAISEQLGTGRLATLTVLSDLVRGGIIDTLDPPEPRPPDDSSDRGGPGRSGSTLTEPPTRDQHQAAPAEVEPPAPRSSEIIPGWRVSESEIEAEVESVTEPSPWESHERDLYSEQRPDADLNNSLAARIAALQNTPDPDQYRPSPASAALDERLAALSGALVTPAAPDEESTDPAETASETEAVPVTATAQPPAEQEPRRKGFLSGFFKPREEDASLPRAGMLAAAPGEGQSGARAGVLAALANALLSEYNNGQYGKGRVDDRITNLLMRADEQADPIDRPLPILGDRLDVGALEGGIIPDRQAAPYLATLVTQIYEDAEHAFGKDKAKRGYRAVQDQILSGNSGALGTDLQLPRV